MAALEALARAYASAHPKRVDDVTGAITTWNFWCASLMFRFSGSTRSYLNATLAGDAAAIVSGDPARAPIGAVHYWGSRGNKGHVAIDVRGKGRRLFMASKKVTEDLGTAIGFITFGDYRTGLTYRGWSMAYGSNAAMTADDVGSFAPGTAGFRFGTEDGEDDMIMRELIEGPDGTVWYCYERVLRFAIPKPKNLLTYQAHLQSLGHSTAIVKKSAEDLNAYGSPVYANPLRMFATSIDGVIGNEAILTAVEGLSAGAPITPEDITAIKDAIASNTAAIRALAELLQGEGDSEG